MPASKHLKTLSVRLPDSEVRRFKSIAATRGVSVQEAVHQALEAWASDTRNSAPDPLDALQGSLTDVDVQDVMRQDRENERRKDRRC